MQNTQRKFELSRFLGMKPDGRGAIDTLGAVATDSSQPSADETTDVEAMDGSSLARTPVVKVSQSLLDSRCILRPRDSTSNATAYKMLRTQVLNRLDQIGANTLAIVSASSSEGKTLTAINLAISLASDHSHTALLVDLDLARPSMHRRFGFDPQLGVEDCLRSHLPIERALVRPQGYEQLTLLPARGRVENSSELLASSRTAQFVAELKNRYANRVIIFDLPPVLEADDALAFSKHIQAALLVVCEGRTRRDDLPRAINLLRDTPIVGTVLNGSLERSRQYY